MLLCGALALAFAFWFGAIASAEDLPGQRTISGLKIDYTVNGTVAQAVVKLSLDDISVDQALLTYDAPTHAFAVAANGMSAAGSLDFTVVQQPHLSSLSGDFSVKDAKGQSTAFKGDLVTWTAADNLALLQINFDLTGNLRARTTIMNGARSGAKVDYLTGDTLLFSSLVLPPSPVSVTQKDLVIGDLRLNKGAQLTLTLTPPSAFARGTVWLECTFSSLTIPPTKYAGLIASWPLQNLVQSTGAGNSAGGSRDVVTVRTSLQLKPVSGGRRRSLGLVRVHAGAERRQPRQAHLAG